MQQQNKYNNNSYTEQKKNKTSIENEKWKKTK